MTELYVNGKGLVNKPSLIPRLLHSGMQKKQMWRKPGIFSHMSNQVHRLEGFDGLLELPLLAFKDFIHCLAIDFKYSTICK